MSRSALLSVAGVVLVAGALGAWLLASGGGSADTLPAAAPASSPEAASAPSFEREAPSVEAGRAQPLQLAPATPEQVSAAAPAAATAAEDAPQRVEVALSGRVTDESGRGVEGARVVFVDTEFGVRRLASRAGGPAAPPPPSTLTGRDGGFTLAASMLADEPRGPFGLGPRLVVGHDAFAHLVHPLGVFDEGEHDVGRLVLEPGAWVSGRVVDAQGRPVAGAEVRGEASEGAAHGSPMFRLPELGAGAGEALGPATSGADGRFRLAGLPAGTASLTARKQGLRPAYVDDVELEARVTRDVGDITLESGELISGVVLDDDGEPVADARISVSSMSRVVVNRLEDMPRRGLFADFGQSTLTDAGGRFEIAGLGAGTYTVHASADGHAGDRRENVAAGSKGVRLTLPRLGSLFVRVTAADASPVSGARISARAESAREGPMVLRRNDAASEVLEGAEALAAAGRSGDPAGAYFVVHAGTEGTELVVRAEGFGATAARAPAVAPGAIGELTLSLPAEARLAGRVVDQSGQPVAGARLRLVQDEAPSGLSFGGGEMRFERRISVGGPADEGGAKSATARSGLDGRYEIAGLAAGDWKLTASAAGHVRSDVQRYTLAAGQAQQDADVELQASGAIEGLVTEFDGRPAPGLEVVVTPLDVAAPDEGEDGPSRALERMLGLPGADGGGRADPRHATADATGRYRVDGLAPGNYEVKLSEGLHGRGFGRGMVFVLEGAEAEEGPPGVHAVVTAGEDAVVNLLRPRRAALSGRVLAAGAPVEGAEVTLGVDSPFSFGSGHVTVTDAGGGYRFDDVQAGKYKVSTIVPGAALEQSRSLEIGEGESRAVDLVFGGATIAGRVVDADDRGVEGVTLTVVEVGDARPPSGGPGGASFEMVMVSRDGGSGGSGGASITVGGGSVSTVRSDASGNFEIRFLDAGSYEIEAGGAGFVRSTAGPVQLDDGQRKEDLRIELTRGAVLSGVVRDAASGQRLDNVPVSLSGSGARQMTVTEDGRYAFEGLATGDYEITVLGSGFGGDPLAARTVSIEGGKDQTLDLVTGG